MPTHRIGMTLTAIGAAVTVAGAAMYVLPGPGLPFLMLCLLLLVAGIATTVLGRGQGRTPRD
ncbi:hypothetical protein ACFYZ4_03160 [Streptomyces sp. NPDC001513]|uniref:hypothetical protein n=1 Tax=Streptomyces sp. NPDC001513 TaxID=3364580 RepID=UPI00368018BE